MGFSPKHDYYLGEDEAYGADVGGTGSAQTLPMSEEEMASVVKRPLGFVIPDVTVTKTVRTRRKKKV